MLDRRRFGILNFFHYRRTNGLSEGFNVVTTIKKNADGFRDWQYFRLKILRKCNKLGTGQLIGIEPSISRRASIPIAEVPQISEALPPKIEP